jgi:hypothetical protein
MENGGSGESMYKYLPFICKVSNILEYAHVSFTSEARLFDGKGYFTLRCGSSTCLILGKLLLEGKDAHADTGRVPRGMKGRPFAMCMALLRGLVSEGKVFWMGKIFWDLCS